MNKIFQKSIDDGINLTIIILGFLKTGIFFKYRRLVAYIIDYAMTNFWEVKYTDDCKIIVTNCDTQSCYFIALFGVNYLLSTMMYILRPVIGKFVYIFLIQL